MDASGDDIAVAVLKQFDALPAKAKPLVRGGGVKEWVPLSGIVAQGKLLRRLRRRKADSGIVGKNNLTCLAIATGMKCLPQDKISRAKGIVLHDWHAEVLAIRSFNRFLLNECHALLSQEKSSEYVRLRSEEEKNELHFQPFALNDGIDLHMYCSEAPCGDASMELTMASQDDSTPWDLPPSGATSEESPAPATPAIPTLTSTSTILHGRGYFSELGLVRRKPSRPDAPPTLSKSCSDKIALAQSTSLLSSITSLLISPQNAYISSLILPLSQHSPIACTRAFSSSGRLSSLKDAKWEGGYSFHELDVKTTSKEFRYSRRQVLDAGEKLVPSNISASWTANSVRLETLIGGVLQGRKQFDNRGASRVSKIRMWQLALEIAAMASMPVVERCLKGGTYGEVKGSLCLEERRRVKDEVRSRALKPWIRNNGGEEFGSEDERTDNLG